MGAKRIRRLILAALCVAVSEIVLTPGPYAQEITLHRIQATGVPADLTVPAPRPLPPGTTTWAAEAWTVESIGVFRLQAPEPAAAAALRVRPIPGEEGLLELRVILFSSLDSLDFRYLSQSEHIVEGGLQRLMRFRIVDGIGSELTGEPGRVVRIVVQDDHKSELRLRVEGEVLLLELVPPELGGRPSGGARPWYEERPLMFLDYDMLAGGWADEGVLDQGFGNNVIAEFRWADFLAFNVNGYFSGDAEDTLVLARAVARKQMFRWLESALWLEGGGAAWQRTKNGEATEASATLTWTFGATFVYRVETLGAAGHVSTVNGPLVIQIMGGWQALRSLGLFAAWHSFDGDSAIAMGLGIDF
ncbi:MAG: hypothetical protein IID61_10965 [SAR324 cluster bacterium]|nr:hypothetical protein [SAR324 cluster bacterium]